jgi:hypothetical protein
MNDPSTPSPPDGYQYDSQLFENMGRRIEEMSLWRQILAGNLAALAPLAAAILLLWLPYQFYLIWGAPLARFANPSWPTGTLVGLAILILLLSVIIHELLHGLVIVAVGHRPRFLIRYGFPLAGIEAGDFLNRRQYVVVALTPVLLMSFVGGVALLLLPPLLGKLVLPVLLVNAAASVGDLFIADRVRRAPPAALFAAADDILVFVPVLSSSQTGYHE